MTEVILRRFSCLSLSMRSLRAPPGSSAVLRKACSGRMRGDVAHARPPDQQVASRDVQAGLVNARCLSSVGSCALVKPGRVIRSAAPSSNAALVLDRLGVSEVIDFRAQEEVDQDPPDVWTSTVEVLYTRNESGDLASTSGAIATDGKVLRHRISILDRDRFYVALLKRLVVSAPLTLLASLLLRVFDAQRSTDLLLQEVNKGGLPQLYEVILESSKPELCAALRIITLCAEREGCAWIYCRAGKDRTGLVAMLVLAAVGASDADIVEDYALSDAHRVTALGNLEDTQDLKKLDREVFSRAPREAMEHVLRYVRKTYGGFNKYLTSIGFTEEWQGRLRASLGVNGAEVAERD